jgi:hypothetical protein
MAVALQHRFIQVHYTANIRFQTLVGWPRPNFSIEIPCVRRSANAANTSVRATCVAHALLRAASPLMATHGNSKDSERTAY